MHKLGHGITLGGFLLGAVGALYAQQPPAVPPGHSHTAGMTHEASATASAALPQQGGQAAYAAISEIARLLLRDSTTDWTRVNLEALRQHLIDMDEVTLRSSVSTQQVSGGIEVEVTGIGRTTDAIRRMTRSHGTTLAGESPYRMTVADIPGGVKALIVAAPGAPAATVTRIRGLGFIGIMTDGDHHAAHHVAIARGAPVTQHAH